MNNRASKELFARAQTLLPGGVSSPVRAFKAVGGEPLFIRRGLGGHVWDADDNEYVDFVGSWGPLILGHAHPEVVEAVCKAARDGTSFGAPTEIELQLAELVVQAFPSIELVRFVSSGTEATMSALRLARAFTGRDNVIKFEGCYHGHADGLLAKAGSGALTFGDPDSPGVPAGYARHTLLARYNDLSSVEQLLEANRGGVAAVIVEPVAGNMGVVPPASGFLAGLRRLADEHGALLAFDEVITGFRVALGGAQELYSVRPDLTCLGKVLGGGLSVGAYGGRRDIMALVSPSGPVYQAGTLSGNPLAMAAGLATLRALHANPPYQELERKGAALAEGVASGVRAAGRSVAINRVGSMATLFFQPGPVTNYQTTRSSNTAHYARFFHRMLERGVYLPPSQFEALFVSASHSDSDLRHAVDAATAALAN